MESKHTEAARPTSTALRVGGRGVFDSGGERNKISCLALTERQTFIKWTVENQQQHNFVGLWNKKSKSDVVAFLRERSSILLLSFKLYVSIVLNMFVFLRCCRRTLFFYPLLRMCSSFIIQRCAFQQGVQYVFFISSSLDMDVNLGRHIMNVYWWNPFPRCT